MNSNRLTENQLKAYEEDGYLPEALLNNGKTEIPLPKDRLICLNVLFRNSPSVLQELRMCEMITKSDETRYGRLNGLIILAVVGKTRKLSDAPVAFFKGTPSCWMLPGFPIVI